jgi:glycosyltransferase 2 family protein
MLETQPLPVASAEKAEAVASAARRSQAAPGRMRRIRAITLVARAVVTLLLLALLLRSISWSALVAALSGLALVPACAGLALGVCGVLISTYQWRALLEADSVRMRFGLLARLYLAGIAFSHFLPTGMGGDAYKALYVGRASGNIAGSASAAVLARVTGFLGMLLIAAPVLLLGRDAYSARLAPVFAVAAGLVLTLLAVATLGAAFVPQLVLACATRWRLITAAMRFGAALRAALARPRALVAATLIGAGFWVAGCLNYAAYGLALGVHISLGYYFVAVPLVSLVTFLPIAINGYGLRESAIVSLLGVVGVSPAVALLLALVMDAQVLLFGAVGSLMYARLPRPSALAAEP